MAELSFHQKLERFAQLLTKHGQAQLHADNLACEANLKHAVARIVPGRKYFKVDVGNSGKYMVDAEGRIFGIKAYGVIHRGHYYGTLDTIENYWWGRYRAQRLTPLTSPAPHATV